MWPNQSAHARRPLIAMQRRAPNDLSAFAACQLQTSSCGAFTFKGRDGAGCCCSWRTRPASGSLPRPAESDRFAWWVHRGALGSSTSKCGQILPTWGFRAGSARTPRCRPMGPLGRSWPKGMIYRPRRSSETYGDRIRAPEPGRPASSARSASRAPTRANGAERAQPSRAAAPSEPRWCHERW